MLQLFPIYKKRILLNIGIWIGFLAILILMFPAVPPVLAIIAAILGALAVLAIQYLHATGAHNGLLNVLYNELDVARFLQHYEPLLNVPVSNKQLYLMIRLHLSNAYCAQGRFEDAIALLSSIQIQEDKPEKMLLSRFTVASNLCYCAEQMNDLPAAKEHLKKLLAIKEQLEDMQKSKPEKKRMKFSTALNEQCLKFLETGKADVEFLKTQVQSSNTQQLHRIITSLWIARAYLANNNRREAEKLLERIVELAPALYPGKCARELLDQMPARTEKKS